jgi:thiosulfate/3-mercaptopyruvate sulfurtransferase
VPGALNRPLTDNLVQGRFKSPQALKQEWLALLGGRNARQVVVDRVLSLLQNKI